MTSFPLLLHVFTSLIKHILWLKFFCRQEAGGGHGCGVGVGSPTRTIGFCSISDVLTILSWRHLKGTDAGGLPLNPLICQNREPSQELGVTGPLLGASPPESMPLVTEGPQKWPQTQTDPVTSCHPPSILLTSPSLETLCSQRGPSPPL